MQNADGFFDDTFRFRYILTNVNNLPKEGPKSIKQLCNIVKASFGITRHFSGSTTALIAYIY